MCSERTLSLLSGGVVREHDSLRPVAGCLSVPRTPPAPDPTLLDTYALSDPAQQEHWRARLCRVRLAWEQAGHDQAGWRAGG